MSYTTIKNEFLTVKIKHFGAELSSVVNASGKEYMWGADESVWGFSSPILFPICGACKDGKYMYKGKEYSINKHGFARNKMFECVLAEESKAVFRICQDEETRAAYPFDYEFDVIFELDGNSIKIAYKTVNKSDIEPLFYSVGAHEAYACPEGICEYSVMFPEDTTLERYMLLPGGISDDSEPFELDNGYLHLDKSFFVTDALIFKNVKSNYVVLEKNDKSQKIRVEFDDMEYFLIWTKPEGNYICIEPWAGFPDSISSSSDFEKKEGIMRVEPGCESCIAHKIIFD